MRTSPEALGKFVLELGNSDLEKHIGGIYLRQELDDSAALRVRLAEKAETLSKWRLNQYPQQASLQWRGKGIFKGHLIRVDISGNSNVELVFSDLLYTARKATVNSFVKQQTLQDCLQKLVSATGLQAKFHGNFSTTLQGFQQGSVTSFEQMEALSAKHGFHFVCRSDASQVAFIKVGEGVSSVKVDAAKQVGSLHFGQTAHASYEGIHFRYFDSKSMETKETNLSSQDLYSPLSSFTDHSSFREKMGWKLAGGKIETHATDRYHFDSGQSLLSGQLSKKLMNQESLHFSCFEPLVLAGDKMQLSNGYASGVQDGVYLVKSCDIEITSAMPKMNVVAIRP